MSKKTNTLMKDAHSIQNWNKFETLEEYTSNFLPEELRYNFRELTSKRKAGLISETAYDEAMNNFVANEIPDEIIIRFTELLAADFEMGNCFFTRHFIARLLSRFSESVIEFLMERIRKLFQCCCKYGRERGRSNGIVLVVDPDSRELITIFTY